VIEKPSSLLQWALLKDKRSIVYDVKDIFTSETDSSEVIWKEGQVRFTHLKDSTAGAISFLQYQVEALDNAGESLGLTDTFWLWQDPTQAQKIYVKGQGAPSMPRFLALKRSDAAEREDVSFLEGRVDTLDFPFFSVLNATWTNNLGSFQEQNKALLQDTTYSWNGKQYRVWQVERTLLHQDRALSKAHLLYGAEGLMSLEQVWSGVRQRDENGILLASGSLKREYRLQYIGD
jgi:hypothetical protein